MTQVMSARDNAALAYAREKLIGTRDEPSEVWGGIEVLWLDKAGNRRFAIEMIKRYAMLSATQLMNIVDDARNGWSLADEALRELILEHINSGRTLPAYLAAYSMEIMRQPVARRPARQKADYYLRDIVICCLVMLVAEKFQMTPYGRNNHNTSACSVVAEALGSVGINMTYKAVAAVWRRYGRV